MNGCRPNVIQRRPKGDVKIKKAPKKMTSKGR